MEPKKENNKALILTLMVSIIVLIGIVIAGTYAFYTATVSANTVDPTKLSTGTLESSIQDGTLTGGNLIPGDTVVKKFSVTNSGSIDLTFKLNWKSVTNTFVNQDDLIVTLMEETTEIISEADNQIFPSTTTTSTILKDNLKIASGETKNYTLTITYKNTNEDQTADMGKTISAVIELG